MVTVRAATAQDSVSWSDIQPDRWRADGNRRSFVAEIGGNLVGHCRGIDNIYHPASRVLVLEVKPEFRCQGTGTALLRAQIQVSTRPLRAKITSDMPDAWALSRKFGGVVEQACPPWQRTVGPQLRAWAHAHETDMKHLVIRPLCEGDLPHVLALATDYYIAQHAHWSPAAEREVLLNLFADDFTPAQLNMRLSQVAVEGGHIVSAACVWTEDVGIMPSVNNPSSELSLIVDRYGDPTRIPVMEGLLASVIRASDEGDTYGIDSHLTETVEYDFVRSLPPADTPGVWLALVAIPVPGAPRPIPVADGLIPSEASWMRRG